MNNAININGLCKAYPSFKLDNVSFTVPSGSIVGFVGENGAGKTTTLKSILDIVHKDSGDIQVFGKDHMASSLDIKQDIGVVFDECTFHETLRAADVGNIFKRAYQSWDAEYYATLLRRFGLDRLTGRKDTIKTYSRGMKMKLSLAAALAHRPKLLILDEATSGLDPVVRDEILDMFLEFIQDEEHSILFSSHITSDIEKAADYLVFIHKGKIVLNAEKDELLAHHALVKCSRTAFETLDKDYVVGTRESSFGIEALISNRDAVRLTDDMVLDRATVDDIMLFTIRGQGK